MNHPTYYTPDELTWIIANAETFTVAEIAFELALGQSVIRNIGTRYNLKFKRSSDPNGSKLQNRAEKKPVRARDPKLIPDPAKMVFERPPAQYSNRSPMGVASEMRKL